MSLLGVHAFGIQRSSLAAGYLFKNVKTYLYSTSSECEMSVGVGSDFLSDLSVSWDMNELNQESVNGGE